MICLDTSLAIQSLAQLKKLRIMECISMKEIVGNEGDEATYNISFSKLKSLELRDLPQIKSFCSGNHTFGFPSLEEVIVSKCPELEIFCKGVLDAPMLQRVQETHEDDKGHWGGDINTTVQQLYAEKVGYKGVEYLVLSEFSNSLELWKQNFRGVLDFVNLIYLEVCDCSSLKYIFTVTMGLELQQLREMKVKNCPMMEQIITNEEAAKNSIKLPRLESITVESCSNLRSFCLGSITMECPSLRSINVDNCPQMLAFASAFVGKQDKERVAPFFDDKVAFPQLEELKIIHMANCRKIWPDQLVGDSFFKLNLLWVYECNGLLNIFPLSMRARLQNLKDFQIRGCESLEEIFEPQALNASEFHTMTAIQSIVEETTTNFVFPALTYLELHKLPRLRSFYSRIHTMEWPSLKKMWIYGCDKVEIFASQNLLSSGESTNQQPLFWVNEVTFRNLEELTLECNGIMKEIWHGQLKAECDGGKGGIVFTRLKSLKLSCLPTLASFCLGDQNFEFPTLEKMIVRECPKMKIFCQGDVSTPQLQKVAWTKNEDEEKGWWESDLKTTIKQIFEEGNIENSEDS